MAAITGNIAILEKAAEKRPLEKILYCSSSPVKKELPNEVCLS